MDYYSILASAIFGAVGGGLGALISGYIKSHSKKGSWSVVFIPIGIIVGLAIGKAVPLLKEPVYDDTIKPQLLNSKIQSALTTAANDINSKTPMMVDQATRLDNAVTHGLIFRYNYTLLPFAAEEVDVNLFRKDVSPKLNNSVCTSDMTYNISFGVTYEYAYYGKNGKQITVIKISKC